MAPNRPPARAQTMAVMETAAILFCMVLGPSNLIMVRGESNLNHGFIFGYAVAPLGVPAAWQRRWR